MGPHSPIHSFQVYDADDYARSHYHLLKRSAGNISLSNATAYNGTSSSSSGVPGTPGQWRLPPDSTGLDRFAHMMHRVTSMSQVLSLYYVLQV